MRSFQVGEICEVISCAAACDSWGNDVPLAPGNLLIVSARFGKVSYSFVTRVGASVVYTMPQETAHRVMRLATANENLESYQRAIQHFTPLHRETKYLQPEPFLNKTDMERARAIVEKYSHNYPN